MPNQPIRHAIRTCLWIVNSKTALEWLMERYQITIDKDSGVLNNPNDRNDTQRYIIDLDKRIMCVSVETLRIVNALSTLNEHK
jgi:predicted helicase